ncbi:NUDIX domain-containing protein [Streptomyces sp. NPDC059063]|uniref:bifunctional class I SAM-dependent methyltransferase/NUDIX hydrolase n=1 Tax=unclassified Streptomyces TaxID=2593676 RepID=UPI0036C69AFE
MSAQSTNEESWAPYGQRQLDHGYVPRVPDRINWSPWPGVGPGAEVLGDVRGKRVLDIGSGPGHHAVHLARAHGALVDGVELSPTQHQRAVNGHGAEPGVRFVCADVAEHLRGARPYDVAYGIHTFGCVDPHRLLPALRDGLTPGAPLVFSALHTDAEGRGPARTVAPREQLVRLRDEEPIPTRMWVLTPQLWEDLLTDHGFTVEAVDLLRAPRDDSPVITQLIRARRRPAPQPARVSSRPRTHEPPVPHAAVGVGVILLGDRGILLGRHRRGTWELPGGSVEPDETFAETAARELHEETGLRARPQDAVLLGTLLDSVQGVVRLTVPAVITTWHGVPTDQPDEAVTSWQWFTPDHLPTDLFVCSAQILTAWRPDLPIDHPPAAFTPYGPCGRPVIEGERAASRRHLYKTDD